MGQRCVQYPWLTDLVVTADATPTISAACSFAIPSGAMGFLDLAYSIRGASTMAQGYVVVPFRNVAGTLTLLTKVAVIAISGDAGLLTAIIDATLSGQTVQPRVTGIAATALTTLLDCRYTLD